MYPRLCALEAGGVLEELMLGNNFLQEAIDEDKVALPSYAYVSLFGLISIDELRQSIFENETSTKGLIPQSNIS